MFADVWGSPYRFFLVAAVLAAILCLFPAGTPAPQEETRAAEAAPPPQASPAVGALPDAQIEPAAQEAPAGADLSARTASGCYLHTTLHYAPCGHSVQRREALPARLVGLSRTLLEETIGEVVPGAQVTGFSAGEVDIARNLTIPCPLHWVLRGGEDGMLCVLQNRSGETLEVVRETDVPLTLAPQAEQEALREGRVFDNVQALEGYLESLTS